MNQDKPDPLTELAESLTPEQRAALWSGSTHREESRAAYAARVAEIVRQRLQGRHVYQIATELGVSEETVYRALRRLKKLSAK